MKKIRSISTLAAVAAASALAVAGPASAGPQGSAASAGAKKDIVETAVAAGQFKTLASLLKKAGLVKTLKGTGPYTVFAPTDAAFAKIPQATLDQLGQDKAKLRSVLLYHVAGRKLTAAEIVKRRSVKTLNGQPRPRSASAARPCASAAPASPRRTSAPPTASSTSSTRSCYPASTASVPGAAPSRRHGGRRPPTRPVIT
jgi:hypothetical protein